MKAPVLTMHWRGNPLRLGEYLKSEGPRARRAYLIVGLKRGRAMLGGGHVFKCTVESIFAANLPEGAVVRGFVWNKREKKRR